MNINNNNANHVCSILRNFDIEPKPLDRIVDAYFRKHRELNSQSRRAIADTVFNVIRWRLRIEGELIRKGIKRPTREQIVAHYLDNAPFEIWDAPPKKSSAAIAAYYSFPEWLVRRFIKQRGMDEACRIMAALKTEAPVTIRTNTSKVTRDDLIDVLKAEGYDPQPTEHSPYGITLARRSAFASDESYKQGLFEIQDEASQLVSIVVGTKPGETILDACAGAGGKSLALAMMMQNTGKIIAADADEKKLKELEKRTERAGVTSITAMPTKDLERMEKYRGKCDAVLLDVPCSGTGTLRRSPDLAFRLQEKDVNNYKEKQRGLLCEYSTWLKPSGRLIYSTCSILEDENEAIVQEFMKGGRFESLGREWMLEVGIDDHFVTEEGYFKVLPDKSSMDGFFACAMKMTSRR